MPAHGAPPTHLLQRRRLRQRRLPWHLLLRRWLLLLLLVVLVLLLLLLRLLLLPPRCWRVLGLQHHSHIHGLQLWARLEQALQHVLNPLLLLTSAIQFQHRWQLQACWGWRCGLPAIQGCQLLQGAQHPPIRG